MLAAMLAQVASDPTAVLAGGAAGFIGAIVGGFAGGWVAGKRAVQERFTAVADEAADRAVRAHEGRWHQPPAPAAPVRAA